jgi:hypothetical protein
MDDSNNGSLVFSRQNLLHVPSEVFGVAAKRPLRCLDLGYNYLQSNEVAALGDLDERSQLNSRSSRGLVSVGSMRHTPVALKDVNNATIRSAGLHPSTPLSVADSVLGAAVPNSRVSTGSVWYHEEQLLIPKLRHLETLYLSNNALKAGREAGRRTGKADCLGNTPRSQGRAAVPGREEMRGPNMCAEGHLETR